MGHHAAASGWRQAHPATTALRAETRDMTAADRQTRRRFDAPLAELIAEAAALRDSAHGRLISYSRKVFIPLTRLCRDVCHYCTFAEVAARGQAGLPLARRGARHRARRRRRRLHRSAVHAGRQARAALPGRARRVEGARPRHDDLLSDRDVRACAARDRIAAACQSRRDDARGDRRSARGDGEPGHHAGVDQRAALRAVAAFTTVLPTSIPPSGWRPCVWPAN